MWHPAIVLCRHWATWLQLPLVLALFSALLGWFGECMLTLHAKLEHLTSIAIFEKHSELAPGEASCCMRHSSKMSAARG